MNKAQALPLSGVSLIRRLKLNQLMIFGRLETGSVIGAAHELRLSQPAVTKVIQELEACVDGKLFERPTAAWRRPNWGCCWAGASNC